MLIAALLLALMTADAPDVSVEVSPAPALVAADAAGQSLSVDLLVRNGTAEPLDLDALQISVFDRAGKLVLRRMIDGNGTRPSIRTADVKELPAGQTTLVFNPFHHFAADVDLHTVAFELQLSSKDGSRRFTETATVAPVVYRQKSAMILPVARRMIVYDGHDFYAHHRRWDYTIPGLRQLGFRTNFMRYSYDFVPVDADGNMSSGPAEKNESWFGFGTPVRAVADGTVVAVMDRDPDDRKFNPASIATDGPMKVWGNYVVIDHGGGEFGLYGHIRNGSAKVANGARVRRGDTIAAIGASGSSMFPHLHFELQNGPDTNAEGLPSVFERYDRIVGSRRVQVTSGRPDSGDIIESAGALGSVSFPASTKNAAAQAELERGLAALHSFWYEEAAASFQRARQLDPQLAMAYWGEAMTHNHPIWQEQDREAARAILTKAPQAPTERERDWFVPLQVLYGEGTKRERDLAYEEAFAKLAAKYPDDVDALSFYALAILGTMDKGGDDARRQMRAAAILEPLRDSHPDHPGVLHYTIHAYDDPLHAPLGLRAARRYAQVAPAAHHALHMPSHIFLQLGMWKEAAASNEHAWAASEAWVARDKLSGAKRDLHSLQWLQYIYLQQGRREEARKLLDEVTDVAATTPREQSARAWMTARWIAETGEPLEAAAGADAAEAAHCAAPSYGSSNVAHYARALLAIRKGEPAASSLAAIATARESAKDPIEKRTLEVSELALRAMEMRKQGKLPEAMELARRAAEIEETLGSPSGPPDVLKPSHELYGELLLAAGKPKEAMEQFRISLQRMPNRAASLAGLKAAASAQR